MPLLFLFFFLFFELASMLRQQSPALHVHPVSEYPTRMTSKQGACNFSTKVGNGPNNSYSFLPLTFISCPGLLNCAQPHYINGWAWCWEMGWLHRSFSTWEAGYNLPYSSPSGSKAFRGGGLTLCPFRRHFDNDRLSRWVNVRGI